MHFKKEELSKINSLSFHIRKLEFWKWNWSLKEEEKKEIATISR